ncbi:MAG: phosphoglycerate kinase [Desulfobacteraceae bacterium 4572_130]|nr:MAG: phosphoglycerate kinase [Desulfobacteraceae bacterium 4572_130]
MHSVENINLFGKRIMVRVDYNLPMDDNQKITDDNRIKATLPLINYLIKKQAKIILMSHMGRPKGKKVVELSLKPVAIRLSKLLNKDVGFIDDCIGENVQEKVGTLKKGEILLLENLRFYNQEKINDLDFAKQLSLLCDVYINDAFAVSHRSHASVVGIVKFVPESTMGFLLEKELKNYQNFIKDPERPLLAIIGGLKISTKLEALKNMLNYVDKLIIGGAMANTFLKSQGINTGRSIVEDDLVETAAEILKKAKEKQINIFLPCDFVVADTFSKDAQTKNVSIHNIPDAWMGLDIGIETCIAFTKEIKKAKTIVWNGPMGVFEMKKFKTGTQAVADAIVESSASSVVGGGETALAAKICNVDKKVDYISTGGGAFLYLMEGKELPAVIALENDSFK